MNTALLLSGGTGIRMHSKVPKQYVRIGDRMLITYALEPLLASSFIDAVQIVAEHEWREAILLDAKKIGLATEKITDFVIPGQNRQSSILNGLQSILRKKDGNVNVDNATDVDTVLIHDAARPLLDGKLIEKCYMALAGHEGVMPVLPVKDTMYLSKDGIKVNELIERNFLYAGQAPELFLLKQYYQANLALLPNKIMEINGSTEPAIIGEMDIVMIEGDERNFKITTKADLQRFQELIKGGKKR